MMKLSEAIRLGAMIRPQTSQAFQAEWGSCVCGAALEAVGVTNIGWQEAKIKVLELWPWTARVLTSAESPDGGYLWSDIAFGGATIAAQLHSLNANDWTRERIADWIETIEPKEDAKCTTTLTTPNSSTCPAISQHSLAGN